MNPVMFKLGNIEIMWYSFLMFIAILFGIILFRKESKRFKFNQDFIFNVAFWSIVFGFIGARLYYVLFRFELYQHDLLSILKVWEGGLAIHGGILFGLITIILYSKKYNINYTKILDMSVVPLILAQAIGRWGNFFNSEAYGSIVSVAKLRELRIPEFIINGMYINGNYYHPTFYYEFLWCIIGFIILLVIRRIKTVKYGIPTSFYLIWYGIGRFVIEKMRMDSLMLGNIKAAQVVSITMIIIGVIMFLILSRRGKYENLYNKEESSILF